MDLGKPQLNRQERTVRLKHCSQPKTCCSTYLAISPQRSSTHCPSLKHNKMGIWPFSSFLPFQYSWSLQPSAKQIFKPDSGAKTLRRAASWPQLQNTVLSLDISLHLSVLLSLPQAVTYLQLQSLQTDKAHALWTYSWADICWWCHSSSQANFLTILLLMPTKCQCWPLIVGFYCSCIKWFFPTGWGIHPVAIQSYELFFSTMLPSNLGTICIS